MPRWHERVAAARGGRGPRRDHEICGARQRRGGASASVPDGELPAHASQREAGVSRPVAGTHPARSPCRRSDGCSRSRSRARSATFTASRLRRNCGVTPPVPARNQSGDKDRRGPWTKQGPRYLRWAMLLPEMMTRDLRRAPAFARPRGAEKPERPTRVSRPVWRRTTLLTKSRICRLRGWRDPDSNREHHDFQYSVPESLTGPKSLHLNGLSLDLRGRTDLRDLRAFPRRLVPVRAWYPMRRRLASKSDAV
jgi:hypothetical protein